MSSKKPLNWPDHLVLKIGQMEFSSTDFWYTGGAPLEKIRCHKCEGIPDIIYPLHRRCEGFGVCEDCKGCDFVCNEHQAPVQGHTRTNGELNYHATKLTVSCPVCSVYKHFLRIEQHISGEHPEQMYEKLEDVRSTYNRQTLAYQTDSKHSQKDSSTQANTCRHCEEKWEKDDLECHERACPEKVVPCRDCGHCVKQGDINEHKGDRKQEQCNFCSQRLAEREIDLHYEICEKNLVECRFQEYGCEKKGPRREMWFHEKADAHNEILLEVINKMRKENTELVKRIQNMENRQHEVDQSLVNIEESISVHNTELQNLSRLDRICHEPFEELINALHDVDKA